MINRKFVASQLRKLAAKAEEVSFLAEAEAKGDFGAIYDFVVEKTFKKDHWEKMWESPRGWGIPILLPSDGSENAEFSNSIFGRIKGKIDDEFFYCTEEFEELQGKTNPSNRDMNRLKSIEKFFRKYGSSSDEWIKTIMKNKNTINKFFNLPESYYYHIYNGEHVSGNWDFHSPLKKYTLVYFFDYTCVVYTSNSPEEILEEAVKLVHIGNNWEELCDEVCNFPY